MTDILSKDTFKAGLVSEGQVTVPTTPSTGTDAASKSYVDGKAGPESDANRNTTYGVGSDSVALTNGADNVVLGYNALGKIVGAWSNVAIGSSALENMTGGYYNVAIGYKAQQNTLASGNNVAIGYRAQQVNVITGDYNIALGTDSQLNLKSGWENVALGSYAQWSLDSGDDNVAVGVNAQAGVTTGDSNIAIGRDAQSMPGGSSSAGATIAQLRQIAIGKESGGYNASTGNEGVSLGYRAISHTQGIALGATAQARGIKSVALGYGAVATLDNQIMLGAATQRVYVNNAPVADLEVATKLYVDGKVGSGGGLTQAQADGLYLSLANGGIVEGWTIFNLGVDVNGGTLALNNSSLSTVPLTITRTIASTSTSDGNLFTVKYLADLATWISEKGNLRTSNKGSKAEAAMKILGASTAEGGTGNILEITDIAGNFQARMGPLGRMNFNKGLRLVGDTIEIRDSTEADTSTISQPLGGSLTIVPKTSLSLSSKKIVSVADPTAAQDAATKNYVDVRTPKITVATTAPSSPAVNDIWVDSNP